MLAAHIGAGGAMSAVTPKLMQKGWQYGTRIGLSGLPLAADIAAINPIAGLVAAGLLTAPMTIPMIPGMATATGAFKAALDTGPLYDRQQFFKDILDRYGRQGQDRVGPDAQARNPREGH